MRNKTIKIIFLNFIALFVSFTSYGQTDWMRYRYELIGGIGPTFFLGELGGNNGIGKNSIMDLDFGSTRFGTNFGLRYNLAERFSTQATLSFGLISGSDKKTTEFYRSDRNISFRSPIYEFNVRLDYKIRKEKPGHIYDLKGVRGQRPIKLVTYCYVGLGVFGFNPQAKIDGEWINLQPIGTEGQNFMATRKPYHRVQLCIPVGLQVKYLANRYWSFSFDVGPRFLFTDYLDDVSTTYVNPVTVAQNDKTVPDKIAELAADPSYENHTTTDANGNKEYTYYNEQRGDPKHNDLYMFAMLSVHYRLKANRNGLPTFQK